MRNTDWYLPRLYSFLPSIGVEVAQANFSRYVADVNRPKGEYPKSWISDDYRNGIIYTKDTWHDPILKNPDVDLQCARRVRDFYDPFHLTLSQMIQSKRQKFGCAYVFDLHSFAGFLDENICLGARKNNETAPTIQPTIKTILEQHFSVAVNGPWSGGHITKKYGTWDNVEVLQIELHYDQYLKANTFDGDRIPEYDDEKADKTSALLKYAMESAIKKLMDRKPVITMVG